MLTTPITFEVPNQEEPVDLIREWALSLRDGVTGSAAGEHYFRPSPVQGQVRIRVHVPKDEEVYEEGLLVLVQVNLWCIVAARRRRLRHPPYPPVFDFACYAPDPGVELWGSIESVYQTGEGDCEDLTCARVAERLAVGDWCRPVVRAEAQLDGKTLYHVLIENPDGSEEDISKVLGMTFGDQHGDTTSARCRARLGASRKG